MTPTPGRAAAVRLAYDLNQARQRRAWRTPQAMGWRAWLEREAIRAADAGEPIPRPLRAAEEWLFWRRAAEAERGGGSGASAWLAGALSSAARLLFEWSIPPRVLEDSESEECQRLARALEFVEARSREAHAAPSHALCGLLIGLESRDPVTFAGFAERSRGRAAWIAAATARSVVERSAGPAPGHQLAVRAADPADELDLAALWCRSQLAADPSRRLLVIVPDLAQRRGEAERVLGQALSPRQTLAGAPNGGMLAVEGGEPLGGLPVVRHALTAFDLLTGALEIGALSRWLRAAFWRLPDPDRARLDEWLRRVLPVEITPRELLSALEAAPESLVSTAATLGAALQGALRELGPTGESAPADSWAQRFRRSLVAIGWPGARALSRLERQAQARFEEALADFIAIGGQVGAVGARDALRLLEALLGEMPLQRASGEAAVTLTGALADPVVRYDGIWVAGLHADAWPPPPAVNPFIPLAAQRQAGIPGVTALGSLAHARALLDVWSRSAAELVTSWPGRLDDSDCLPSPLIAERPGVESFIPGERPPSLARSLRAARRSETFDDSGSPWPVAVPLPAGTRSIDRQARCPFRAYAELRLAALPLETPRPGVDPRERGRLMHRALEHLWRELGGSEGLGSRAAAGDLARLIEACVARAAVEIHAAAGNRSVAGNRLAPENRAAAVEGETTASAAWRRELRRAARVLRGLAALERQRAPFRVRVLEGSRHFTLGDAALDVRIDRIDELDDGTLAILDYKTGRPAALEWLADRLSEPQLLVYLLAAGGVVSALAQVELAAGGLDFRGLADRAGRLPGVGSLTADAEVARDAWREQTGRWRSRMEQLARDFLSGSAAVDPAPLACRSCHLHTFCRVSEGRDGG